MEYHPLLLSYVKPCILGKSFEQLPKYEEIRLLQAEEEIRKYFFTTHNLKEFDKKNLIHLVLPYRITPTDSEILIAELAVKPQREILPSQRSKLLQKTDKSPREGILITHAKMPVDFLSLDEFKKYEDIFVL